MSKPGPFTLADAIVRQAFASLGHCYVFGGAPGPNGASCWDCSSCVNYNIGRVNQEAIPGFTPGSYDGSVHGPSTLGWLGWQGIGVGSVPRDQCQAADIACWQTHMGIAISNSEMISAANPADGTIRSQIDGFIQGEQLVILRLKAIGKGGITFPVPTFGNPKAIEHITRQIADDVRRDVTLGMAIRSFASSGVRL